MMLVCSPIILGVYEFESELNLWWKICELDSPSLAKNDEIELDNLCPMTAAEVVENLSEDNENGVDFESPLEEQN